MDAIEEAREAINWTEQEMFSDNEKAVYFHKALAYAAIAQAESAQAQAEQLKRIADSLDSAHSLSQLFHQ